MDSTKVVRSLEVVYWTLYSGPLFMPSVTPVLQLLNGKLMVIINQPYTKVYFNALETVLMLCPDLGVPPKPPWSLYSYAKAKSLFSSSRLDSLSAQQRSWEQKVPSPSWVRCLW